MVIFLSNTKKIKRMVIFKGLLYRVDVNKGSFAAKVYIKQL